MVQWSYMTTEPLGKLRRGRIRKGVCYPPALAVQLCHMEQFSYTPFRIPAAGKNTEKVEPLFTMLCT